MISYRPHVNTHQYCFLRGMQGLLAAYSIQGKGASYAFSMLGNFFFTFGTTKKSCGAFQNQSSEHIKLTFSQSDEEKLNNRLFVNHFHAATLRLILHVLIKAGISKRHLFRLCISIHPKLAGASGSTLPSDISISNAVLRLTFNKILSSMRQQQGQAQSTLHISLSKQSRNKENSKKRVTTAQQELITTR